MNMNQYISYLFTFLCIIFVSDFGYKNNNDNLEAALILEEEEMSGNNLKALTLYFYESHNTC